MSRNGSSVLRRLNWRRLFTLIKPTRQKTDIASFLCLLVISQQQFPKRVVEPD